MITLLPIARATVVWYTPPESKLTVLPLIVKRLAFVSTVPDTTIDDASVSVLFAGVVIVRVIASSHSSPPLFPLRSNEIA